MQPLRTDLATNKDQTIALARPWQECRGEEVLSTTLDRRATGVLALTLISAIHYHAARVVTPQPA